MQLADFRRSDDQQTTRLEEEARAIRQVMKLASQPSDGLLSRVQRFLIDVEFWKADCMQEGTGNAAKNPPIQIWESLQGAVTATGDLDALLSIMKLVGFRSSRDEDTGQRRAKRATAVMRFLDPDEWGTVDWRTIAILSFYKRSHLDIDLALIEARKHSMRSIASDFDLIDENMALGIVEEYRNMRDRGLSRTADVELALYGASFIAWPRTQPNVRSGRHVHRILR